MGHGVRSEEEIQDGGRLSTMQRIYLNMAQFSKSILGQQKDQAEMASLLTDIWNKISEEEQREVEALLKVRTELVYVAGKFTGENEWEVEKNIRLAEEMSMEISDRAHARGLRIMPLPPHKVDTVSPVLV